MGAPGVTKFPVSVLGKDDGTTYDLSNLASGAGGGPVSIASGAVASGAFASGALASGSVAAGAMVDLGAQADAAWTSGSGTAIALLKAIAAQAISTSPVQVYSGNSFLNVVAGTATTTVKSGAGTLVAIIINTKGASSNVLTVFDNTAASGTAIATIDTTLSQIVLRYDLSFATGLTIKSTTGTGADFTVIYR